MIFKNCRLLLGQHIVKDMWIEIEGTKILNFGSMSSYNDCQAGSVYNLMDMLVTPGFIDQHVHGASGCDFMDGNREATDVILSTLSKEGVTSLLATTVTSTHEEILKALKSLSEYMSIEGPELLGIHLEGPYLSPKAPGAHKSELLIKPSVDTFKVYESAALGKIKMVTLAVEEDENYELIQYLKSKKIIASIGHSVASAEQAKEAIEIGCQCITHCYNAMSGLHHRDVGVVGTTLLTPGLKAEIIADGIHVSDEALRVFDKMKAPEDKILVTDAMRAKGLGAGRYDLGGQWVHSDGEKVITDDGALAGSVLTCDNALRNYMDVTRKPIEEVLKMLTETPAKLHNVFDRKGSIQKGKDADLVVLDSELNVHMTICRGKVAYKRTDEDYSS